MIIDCISDLHGYYPTLEGGDLLIVAGDLTARDTPQEHSRYIIWLYKQTRNLEKNYKKVIFIAGNHDNYIQKRDGLYVDGCFMNDKIVYLCDSGTEFEGLKIWGSPWSLKFKGMNPKCMAFTCDTEEELSKKWKLIPDDVHILVTHNPPYGICDYAIGKGSVGSNSLLTKSSNIKTKLHVFGHIHESYGQLKTINLDLPHFVNASHVNEHYKPINKPIRVIL